jgi:predicted protein tyrosine phosphatase
MKILFVCSQARLRSKTAAHCLSINGASLDYAGLNDDADKLITKEQTV